jgi:hypothetical protein
MKKKTQKTKGKAKKIQKPQPTPEQQQSKREKLTEFVEVLLPEVKKFRIAQGRPLGKNEGIKNVDIFAYYQHIGKGQIFKTFQAWKKEGYHVKKGEKGLLCYGSKVEREKEQQPEQPNSESKKYSFFPIGYVFSDLQVKNTNEHEEGTGNA